MPEQTDEQFMQRRLLIASVLSAMAMVGYIYMQESPAPAPDETPATRQAVSSDAPSKPADTPDGLSQEPGTAPGGPDRALDSSRGAEIKAAKVESESIIETDMFKVTFSNKGAVVKSWILKDYENAKQDGELDLVHRAGAEDHGYPFEVDLPGGGPLSELDDALFVMTREPAFGAAGPSVVFEYSDAGISATKVFRFQKEGYLLRVESEVSRNGVPQSHLLTWKGGFGDTAQLQNALSSATLYYDPVELSVERNEASDAEDERLINIGSFTFAGINDLFFAACFLPPEEQNELRLETSAVSIVPAEGESEQNFAAMGIGAQGRNEFDVFVGPKSVDILGPIRPELTEIVDFGTVWGFIAEPIFWMLRWTYANVVSNYGWSIIAVAVFINFATFPLKWKSMKSMKKMQALQPLVKEINERYKGLGMRDPKKKQQQEEMMALYKKHGVNPLGGCLPMLLQLPFFIGFYNVLSVAIEMRQAEWLWVQDLSTYEHLPIRVLPIAMVATQYWQQAMSPPTASADPAQMRLMKFMPLMMGFFFYGFSSGLVLFWLTGNLAAVLQQVIQNRFSSEEVVIQAPRGRKKKKSKSRG